jgi:hypothetical protein
MIRIIVALLVAAAPAAAQVPSLSFDSGKSLPIATGQWAYVATTSGSEARYGAHIAIRCDRATRIVSLTRTNRPNASLTISTSELTRALPAGGRLVANDPLLDAIAFSRGRFLVSSESEPVLAIPSWPEAARSIEDCRN